MLFPSPTKALPLLALFSILLAFAGPNDLEIAAALTGSTPHLAETVRRFGEWPGWVAVIVAIALLRRRLPSLAQPARATLILAVLHPVLITQALKYGWGRVRYRDLAPYHTDYTPFWRPGGLGVGESFPSGHVAMATVVLPLSWHLIRQRHPVAKAAGATLAASVGVVGWGRMAAGAHYASDVLFSIAVGAALTAALSGDPAPTPRQAPPTS